MGGSVRFPFGGFGSDNEDAALLAGIGQALLDQLIQRPFFWAGLAAMLAAIIFCSLACFEKKWLRALVAGAAAAECFWLLCAGWV